MDKIAIEYGDGLFELACGEGLADELLEETTALRGILRDQPGYTRLMTSKKIDFSVKQKLLQEAFEGKIHAYLYNFLRLMNDRGYFAYVPACMTRFEERYFVYKNVKLVTVRSASALDPSDKARIASAIEKKLGIKAKITWIEDRTLIAGLRIEADGVLIENSAKKRLEDMKKHLGSAVTGNL